MSRFDGAIAFVTGAAGGIGQAICARLAAEGVAIAAVDRDGDGARALAARLRADGAAAAGIACDVTDATQVEAAFAEAGEALGGPVTLLVNNAALCTADGAEETAPERWDGDVAVTLRGPYLCIRAALPGMRAAGGGSIVNVTTVNAAMAFGNDAYSAAKAGVEALTRGVAMRHGRDGIRCNAVAPGTIRTPAWGTRLERDPQVLERMAGWYPLGRVGEPDDVAAAVAFLGSADAAWISGAVLPVDGGLLAGNARLTAELIPGHAERSGA